MTRLGADIRSLELDGRDRLFTDVPEDTVDALDGGDDPVADRAEDGEGDLRNRGGDGIDGVDRADDHGPAHVPLALAVHIADAGEELLRIIAGDDYGIYEKAAAVGNLDRDHADTDTLRTIALNAEGGGFGVHAEHGLAAVEKLEDQEALLDIATEARDGLVAIHAAKTERPG